MKDFLGKAAFITGAASGIGLGIAHALANAVADALSPLGIHHLDLPCTPERVWRAIRQAPRPAGKNSAA